jgi:hypothetical protein
MTIPTRIQTIKSLASGITAGDRPLREVLVDLNKRLPNDWVSFKPTFSKGKKGNDVPYISHIDISLILDYLTNFNWSVEFSENQVGDYVTVKCRLTIMGLARESIGNEPLNSPEHFGGPLCDAQAMSFRRSASLFGLGRYLYYPEIPATVKEPTLTQ